MAFRSNNAIQNQIAKLQIRLETALSQRQFYDAHQIIRTMHSRMLQKQININDVNEMTQLETLLDLIYNSGVKFCQECEFSSAIDLAELYVDTCKRTNHKLDIEGTDKLVQLFTILPAKLEGEDDNKEANSASAQETNKNFMPKDRRNPFLNKTLDWALKTAEGCPELLNSVVLLQRSFAEVFENEGRKQQAERLNQAADWLMKEIDRKMQSTSGSTTSNLYKEETNGEQQIKQTGKEVNDIDLD